MDVRGTQIGSNVENTEKEEFVPMSADKPYGLDVETFLPVNIIHRGARSTIAKRKRVITLF